MPGRKRGMRRTDLAGRKVCDRRPEMIEIGATVPTFKRVDHLGRTVDLAALRGKRHVMLLFYPLDFTPT
jgi:hypothetical protein